MSTPVLLLTLTIDGQVVRVATDAVDVTDAALSRVYPYSPGITDITVSSALSFLASSGPLSVPVEAVLPVDVAALSAAGVILDGSAAELALLTPGDDYGRRVVLAAATVTGAEWGELGQPVRFSIARADVENMVEVPSATEQVDWVTMPSGVLTLSPGDLGLSYPRVYGSPGRIDATDWVTGGQGVWVRHDGLYHLRLVIAGQWIYGSEFVWLSGDADIGGHRFRLYNTRDSRGQPVAVVAESVDFVPDPAVADADSPGVILWDTDADGYFYGLGCDFRPNGSDNNPNLPPELYQPIGVDASSAVFWSFRGPGASDGLSGKSPLVGDVIVDLLARTGARTDYGRWQAAARLLAGYRLDFVIDARVKIMEFLRSAILPLLPLSIESGPAGDYPVVWQYDAPAVDATAAINADRDPAISRASAIKGDSSQIANAFALQYAYSVRTGSYTETVTRDATTCPYCAASERRWGRVERQVQTVVVYDSATAAAILAWMARAYTGVRRSVSYLVPATYALTRGQVVTLTDSLVSLSAVVCLVSDVQVDGTGIDGVEFLIIG